MTPAVAAIFIRKMENSSLRTFELLAKFESLHQNVYVFDEGSCAERHAAPCQVPWPVLATLSLSRKHIMLGTQNGLHQFRRSQPPSQT